VEVGSNVYSQEEVSQVDLLEAFADQEVSIFGVTGTFEGLAQMCPVDLNDPSVTLEAKNEFVVKAANEAGLEIKPEYESVFSQIIEQNGLERKFTVTSSDSQPPEVKATVEPGHIKLNETFTRTKHSQVPAQRQKADTSRPAVRLKIEEQHAATMIALRELAEKQQFTQSREQLNHIAPVQTVIAEKTGSVRPGRTIMRPEKSVPQSLPEATPQILSRVDEHVVEAETSQTEVGVLASNGQDNLEAASLPVNVAKPFNESPAIVLAEDYYSTTEPVPEEQELVSTMQSEETLQVDPVEFAYGLRPGSETLDLIWSVELSKEPLDLYEDFAEGLLLFSENVEDIEAVLADGETFEQQDPPSIIITVAERLAELEPDKKELVTSILKDIVEAIHGVHVLEASEANEETVTAAKAQLEELCITLFEAAGIDYNEQAVKVFAQAMLHPEFRLSQPDDKKVELLDLEHVGTREAKRFSRWLSALSDTRIRLEHVLGEFALFCTRANNYPSEHSFFSVTYPS
jgi:hypothetical protein